MFNTKSQNKLEFAFLHIFKNCVRIHAMIKLNIWNFFFVETQKLHTWNVVLKPVKS